MRLILPVCLLVCLVWACSRDSHNSAATLQYELDLDPARGIQVTLRANGLRPGKPGFRIFSQWGLLEDQGRHIEGLRAETPEGIPVPMAGAAGPASGWAACRDSVAGLDVFLIGSFRLQAEN